MAKLYLILVKPISVYKPLTLYSYNFLSHLCLLPLNIFVDFHFIHSFKRFKVRLGYLSPKNLAPLSYLLILIQYFTKNYKEAENG